ncbi:MAG: hypothetical protein LBN39_05075 [Planctomycetaceae bacterium]|jgi:hypothetical protein|nr:hypothetical protein [Planctomycetaceae bacterium]
MDSERRHHLMQNDLAHWIIAQYEDWIQPNSRLLSTAGILIFALLLVFLYSSRALESSKAASWRQYFAAIRSPNAESELEAIALAYSGRPVGEQARLSLARQLLAEGISQMFIDKGEAEKKIEKALQQLQQLQATAKTPDVLMQAGFGTGQVYETFAAVRTGKNDLAEAENAYKALADKYPNEFWGKRAKEQLTLVSRPSTKRFFELAAAKVLEKPKADDFKVDDNLKSETFDKGPTDFDPGKALDALANPEENAPKPAAEPPKEEKK